MVGCETEGRFKIGLDEDQGDNCSCNDDAFEGGAFHGDLGGEYFFRNSPIMEIEFESFNRAGLFGVCDSEGWRAVDHPFNEKIPGVNPSGNSGEVCVVDDRPDTIN